MTCTAWRLSWFLFLIATIAAVCCPARLLAEETTHAARLSYLDGDASVERADNTGTDPAQLNMPLLEGMRLITLNGEAEIELEDGIVLRLTPRSAIALTALDGQVDGHSQTVITVLYGLVYAELRVTNEATTVLHAGPDSIMPITNAAMRVLFDKPPAAVAVLAGTARVQHTDVNAAGGYEVDLNAGQWLDQSADDGGHTVSQTIPFDSWDNWNERRAQLALDDSADRTAARDAFAEGQAYGWSDLDSNGFWYDMGGQDLVWQPFAAASPEFDPYASGSWTFAGGSGYVWASAYPWGWTPFRCGSWAFSDSFGWGWSPSASCGGAGWRFGAGGGVNVSRVPPGYHRPAPPNHQGPPRAHPIVIASSPSREGSPLPEPGHTFGGVPALPLRPIAPAPVEQRASAVGSALLRDFPVDRSTRQPVLGVVGPAAVAPVRVAGSTEPANATRETSSQVASANSPRRPEYDSVSGTAVGAPPRRQAFLPSAIPGASSWPARNGFAPSTTPGAAQSFPGRPLSAPMPGPARVGSAPAPVHTAPPPPAPSGSKK